MPRDTKSYEGFKSKVYKDTSDFDTIGYGHKLTAAEKKSGKYAKGISEEDASTLYYSDRAAHDKKFYKRNPQYADAPDNVKAALEDMAYNMGPNFLTKFPKASGHLASGNYADAGKEFLDSEYAREVGQRAADNVALMSGTPTPQAIVQAPVTDTGIVFAQNNKTPQQNNIATLFSGLGDIQAPQYTAPAPVAIDPYTQNQTGLGGMTGFDGLI